MKSCLNCFRISLLEKVISFTRLAQWYQMQNQATNFMTKIEFKSHSQWIPILPLNSFIVLHCRLQVPKMNNLTRKRNWLSRKLKEYLVSWILTLRFPFLNPFETPSLTGFYVWYQMLGLKVIILCLLARLLSRGKGLVGDDLHKTTVCPCNLFVLKVLINAVHIVT